VKTAFKIGVYAVSLLLMLGSAGLLYIAGHWPSEVEDGLYNVIPFSHALKAVDGRGFIRTSELKAHRTELDAYAAVLKGNSPAHHPEQFSVDEATAYWLNAYHAMVLMEVREVRSESQPLRDWLNSLPIGGQRLTRYAIAHRLLFPLGDARVFFALFDGTLSSGVLDGAPFDGEVLSAQLDDAARRFMKRKNAVSLKDKTVKLAWVFQEHEEELLQGLPADRRNLLQIVWAYLPDDCDDSGVPCLVRSDLDRACGSTLSQCTLEFLPRDAHLAIAD
jgi:Protein of unknown function, DUF547